MRLRLLIAAFVATFALHVAPAQAGGLCIPDMDGGCRYCEIRKSPPSIICTN